MRDGFTARRAPGGPEFDEGIAFPASNSFTGSPCTHFPGCSLGAGSPTFSVASAACKSMTLEAKASNAAANFNCLAFISFPLRAWFIARRCRPEDTCASGSGWTAVRQSARLNHLQDLMLVRERQSKPEVTQSFSRSEKDQTPAGSQWNPELYLLRMGISPKCSHQPHPARRTGRWRSTAPRSTATSTADCGPGSGKS